MSPFDPEPGVPEGPPAGDWGPGGRPVAVAVEIEDIRDRWMFLVVRDDARGLVLRWRDGDRKLAAKALGNGRFVRLAWPDPDGFWSAESRIRWWADTDTVLCDPPSYPERLQRRAHFRVRVTIDVGLTFLRDGVVRSARGETVDVSAGGLSAAGMAMTATEPLGEGTSVGVLLHLPLLGTVAAVASVVEAAHHRAPLRLRFDQVDPAGQEELTVFLNRVASRRAR